MIIFDEIITFFMTFYDFSLPENRKKTKKKIVKNQVGKILKTKILEKKNSRQLRGRGFPKKKNPRTLLEVFGT